VRLFRFVGFARRELFAPVVVGDVDLVIENGSGAVRVAVDIAHEGHAFAFEHEESVGSVRGCPVSDLVSHKLAVFAVFSQMVSGLDVDGVESIHQASGFEVDASGGGLLVGSDGANDPSSHVCVTKHTVEHGVGAIDIVKLAGFGDEDAVVVHLDKGVGSLKKFANLGTGGEVGGFLLAHFSFPHARWASGYPLPCSLV